MVRGRYTMGRGVKIAWMGRGVKIPLIGGSKYHGYGGRYIMGRWSKYHGYWCLNTMGKCRGVGRAPPLKLEKI